jgi:Tfp pilus assembly protein PilN
MRAVNLIPGDARRGGRAGPSVSLAQLPAYIIIGALAVMVGFAALYVLTTNKIGDRQAQLTSLKAEVAQAQAQAGSLASFSQFEQIASTRVLTVRQLASTRFDWKAALTDLTRVVPRNTTLQTLSGTVAPGGAGGGSSFRSDIAAPALEVAGCTGGQDDVARLMSRLRVINGVTRVTLSSSAVVTVAQAGVSSAGAPEVCKPGGATFNLVVFFRPLPGAGAAGATLLPALTNVTPAKVAHK